MQLDPLAVTLDLISDKVRFTGALRENAPVAGGL